MSPLAVPAAAYAPKTRVVIFDTETTGRSPGDGDRIVEIGAVEMIGFDLGRTYHAYVNPMRDVPEEVVRVHGLRGDFLAKQPRFDQICDELLAFFGERDLIVAHNAEFDRGFLNAELARLSKAIVPQNRFIDTLALAKTKLRAGSRLSLDALSKYYRLDQRGFDLNARKGPGGHGALLDAQMLAEIYIELQGGREQALFEEDGAAAIGGGAFESVRRPPRPTPMRLLSTPEEHAAHAAFIAALGGKSLWGV